MAKDRTVKFSEIIHSGPAETPPSENNGEPAGAASASDSPAFMSLNASPTADSVDVGGGREARSMKQLSPLSRRNSARTLERRFNTGDGNLKRSPFPSNHIATSKYEWWNIVPKNLLEQFRRAANIWFLVVSIVQLAPLDISPTIPTATLVPLCAVLFVTFLKDAWEDHRRKRDDRRVDNQLCKVLNDDVAGKVQEILWKDLTVGTYVKLERDDPVPGDMILLACANTDGVAYVDTAQLDGETSLKTKFPLEETMRISRAKDILALEGRVETEPPNEQLQSFHGILVLRGHPRPACIEANNFLLRGSTLRNTAWAYGLTVYTGYDTKLAQNLKKAPSKRSRVEITSNYLLLIVFGILVAAASISTLAQAVYLSDDSGGSRQRSWVWPVVDPLKDSQYLSFLTFMILYNNLIPISLYMTTDLVRHLQGLFLERDQTMYHATSNSGAQVRNSSLMENLGQVEFVLTDKTGTLTENQMLFKAASIAGCVYGFWDEQTGPVEQVAAVPARRSCTPLNPELLRKQAIQPIVGESPSLHSLSALGNSAGLLPSMTEEEDEDAEEEVYTSEKSDRKSSDDPGGRPSPSPRAQWNSERSIASIHSGHRMARATSERSVVSAGSQKCKSEGDNSLSFCSESSRATHVQDAVVEFFLCLATCHTAIVEGVDTEKLDNIIKAGTSSQNSIRSTHSPSFKGKPLARGPGSPEASASRSSLQSPSAPVPGLSEEAMKASFRSSSPDEVALLEAARDFGFLFRSKTASRITVNVNGRDHYYTVLILNEFSSERKRMSVLAKRCSASQAKDSAAAGATPRRSVVVEPAKGVMMTLDRLPDAQDLMDDDEDYPAVLYAKGADNVMLERLSVVGAEQARSDTFRQHLVQFASKGLRTLVVAKRELTDQQTDDFLLRLREAKGAFMNREAMMESLANDMEQEFEILGITAIEDRIQQGVPETVHQLQRAGIKVWMLTGDNMETSMNIGTACQLIDSSMQPYRLELPDSPTPGAAEWVRQHLESCYMDIHQRIRAEQCPGVFKYYVIMHGNVLYSIMDDPHLRLLLLEIACASSAVIACRLAPAQKAGLVQLVSRGIAGSPLTLAIGDGGNDVSMIQAAHVGIGILGAEGRQAANAADFTIGQFRFLQRLLFVHGRWNLRRISLVIGYFFYKNFLMVMPMMMYAQRAGFSGTTLYDSYLLAIYNLVFTSLPIMIAGVFDWDVSPRMAMIVPSLYQLGINGHYFNRRMLVGWLAKGSFHAGLIFVSMVCVFDASVADSSPGGHNPDILVMGSWAYGACTTIANATMLLHTKAWMDWQVVITLLSSLLFVPAMLTYSRSGLFLSYFEPNMAGVASSLFEHLRSWLAMLLVVVACVMSELAVIFTAKSVAPNADDILQEVEMGHLGGAERLPRAEAWGKDEGAEPAEECLKRVPAPAPRCYELNPEGSLRLRPLRGNTKHKSRAVRPIDVDREAAASSGDVTPGGAKVARLDAWMEAPTSCTERVRFRVSDWLTTFWECQWAELNAGELAERPTYDRMVASKGPLRRNRFFGNLSRNKVQASPSAAGGGGCDSDLLGSDVSEYGTGSRTPRSPCRVRSTASVATTSTARSMLSSRSARSGSLSSMAGDISNVKYSMLSLRFSMGAQEAAFKKFLERQALPIFRVSLLFVCLYWLLYNVLVWVSQPELVDSEDAWVHIFTLAASIAIPAGLVASRILCYNASCVERAPEPMMAALALTVLAVKHLYDIAVDSHGVLFNTYVVVFIVAFARIRFCYLAAIYGFHLFLIVLRYWLVASLTSNCVSCHVSARQVALMLGTAFLTLNHSWQLELLMRKGYFILDSTVRSHNQGMEILKGMFPEEVVSLVLCKIRGNGAPSMDRMQEILKDRVASVLFLDILDFDGLVDNLRPEELVQLLDQLWYLFDRLCDRNALAKIETVGKTYMAAALPDDPSCSTPEQHAKDALSAVTTAIYMIEEGKRRFTGTNAVAQVSVRIGIHTGRVLSGVVGSLKPQFALFGDTVNTASRMQSTGERNRLHVSSSTWFLLRDDARFGWSWRQTTAKGKGLMDTYILSSYNLEELKRSRRPGPIDEESGDPSKPANPLSKSLTSTGSFISGKKTTSGLQLPSIRGILGNGETQPPLDGELSPRSRTPDLVEDPGRSPLTPLAAATPSSVGARVKSDISDERRPSIQVEQILMPASSWRDYVTCPPRIGCGTSRAHLYRIWGSPMWAQWASFACFLAVYSSQCLVVVLEGSAPELEVALRLGYVALAAALAAALWYVGHIYSWGQAESTGKLISGCSRVIAGLIFLGFCISAASNDLEEEDEFRCIFEAFFFVAVMVFHCRLHPSEPVAVWLGLPVVVYILSYAEAFEWLVFLECVGYYVLICATHLLFLRSDPRAGAGASKHKLLCEEHDQVLDLVNCMLPREVLAEMKSNKLSLAYKYEDMTFLFADIVGFTSYCAAHTAEQAVNLVTRLFALFDDEARRQGIYKVCTIGDAYVATNEPRRQIDEEYVSCDDGRNWNGIPIFEMAHWMLETIISVRKDVQHDALDMRIGLHFGKFVGGVIGTKRLRFDIWGQDVLVGNNVESHGKPGKICVSEPAKLAIQRAAAAGVEEARGIAYDPNEDIVLKGGLSVKTYIIRPLKEDEVAETFFHIPPEAAADPPQDDAGAQSLEVPNKAAEGDRSFTLDTVIPPSGESGSTPSSSNCPSNSSMRPALAQANKLEPLKEDVQQASPPARSREKKPTRLRVQFEDQVLERGRERANSRRSSGSRFERPLDDGEDLQPPPHPAVDTRTPTEPPAAEEEPAEAPEEAEPSRRVSFECEGGEDAPQRAPQRSNSRRSTGFSRRAAEEEPEDEKPPAKAPAEDEGEEVPEQAEQERSPARKSTGWSRQAAGEDPEDGEPRAKVSFECEEGGEEAPQASEREEGSEEEAQASPEREEQATAQREPQRSHSRKSTGWSRQPAEEDPEGEEGPHAKVSFEESAGEEAPEQEQQRSCSRKSTGWSRQAEEAEDEEQKVSFEREGGEEEEEEAPERERQRSHSRKSTGWSRQAAEEEAEEEEENDEMSSAAAEMVA